MKVVLKVLSCCNLATGFDSRIIRYSVSSPPSMQISHWSNSGVPCSLQKYRRQRLHVMKVILTRSAASHCSHCPALRALGIAMSPWQVYEFSGCAHTTWA